jgi:hypothetical protein
MSSSSFLDFPATEDSAAMGSGITLRMTGDSACGPRIRLRQAQRHRGGVAVPPGGDIATTAWHRFAFAGLSELRSTLTL